MAVSELSVKRFLLSLAVAAALAPGASAQWVQFEEETGARLVVSDPGLVLTDTMEKDYAWADFDQDGDIDLAIVRKEPFIVDGPQPNVLLINENGLLMDRTLDFATASDVAGDLGFHTPTNDRDVVAVDVDQDGWIDLVTGPTISPGEPKHIGHPRIYRNLGCQGACNGTDDWLGFEHQDARIPEMLSWTGDSGFNPCICHLAAGDVTADGYPDLWLVDYDDGCGGAPADFNSRLLINQGASNPGFFTDETQSRFLGTVGGLPFPVNVDSLSGWIVDMNDDDVADVILESEGVIDIAYNDPANGGFFDTYSSPPGFSTYNMGVADLNNDGLMDMITTDDGADRYYLSQGPSGGPIPTVDFISYVYSFQHFGEGGPAGDDGFGDDAIAADLDMDGWTDVLTADVDFTFAGCDRRGHIYRNLGGEVGGFVSIQEQTTGSGCQNFFFNPPTCIVASIPADKLVGTHDYAIFDINGDNWLDMVIGRCSGTEIYINQPPVGPAGAIPESEMLLVGKVPDSTGVSLSWGDSCVFADDNFAVYEGDLDLGFTNHEDVTCDTGGATMLEFEPSAGNCYYLVVPHNETYEGSYGVESGEVPRDQGASACFDMNAQNCG